MEKLNRSTNLFEVSVNKYDELLVLDCDDIAIFQKFSMLYDNVMKISDEAEEEVKALKEKYGEEIGETANADSIRDYVGVNITFSKKIMSELDDVFGQDFVAKVYRENFELNPDFVPSETALSDLIESLGQVMEKAYGKRIERNKGKYSAAKRGKHTVSSEKQSAGRNGENE